MVGYIYLQDGAIRTTFASQIAHREPYMPTVQVYSIYVGRIHLSMTQKKQAFTAGKRVFLLAGPANRHGGANVAT